MKGWAHAAGDFARGPKGRLAVRLGLLLAGFAGALAVALWLARSEPPGPGADDSRAAPERLVPAPIERLSAVELMVGGNVHRFERDAKGRWFLHQHRAPAAGAGPHVHVADPAIAARIEKAFAKFTGAPIERVVADGGQGAAYGVDRPELIVMLYAGGGQPDLRLMVGDITPDRSSRYVMILETRTVVTIPASQITTLTDLVASLRNKG